jgi:exodeoxyribonuclease V alpha subunit
MLELDPAGGAELEWAAQTVSAWRAAGHICIPLTQLAPKKTVEKLRTSRVVGAPGEFKPLILDAEARLYLHRYWQYETISLQ